MSSHILLTFFLAAAISLLSYILKFLHKSGAISTFILACLIFGSGKWKWTIPILTFFLLSSILSKINKKRHSSNINEKQDRRDYVQVLANGGLGGALAAINFFYSPELLYIIYVSTIAAVCSDTWSTEIGIFFKSRTLDILTFKDVEQGKSGGISIPGTIGGIIGSLIIAKISSYWFVNYISFYFVAAAGIFGNIIDSILGSAFQRQNRCTVCQRLTEQSIHCSFQTVHYSGLRWLNNDFVNLGAAAGGGLIILIINFFWYR